MSDLSEREDIRSVIARFPMVTLAYLFGSQVDGRVGPMSDYDIAVLTEDIQDVTGTRARIAHELAGALSTDRVDVVILNQAPVELAYAIIAQGKLIYQRDNATRVEYEARVLGRYGDYLPVLRAQRQDIHRGGEHAARVQRYREALGRTERKINEIRTAQRKGPR